MCMHDCVRVCVCARVCIHAHVCVPVLRTIPVCVLKRDILYCIL